MARDKESAIDILVSQMKNTEGMSVERLREIAREAWEETLSDRERAEADKDFEAQATPPVIQGTSSSNPSRPRTLSAGYDRANQVLTVLFREGQWWEYRGVPEEMWFGFRDAESKGKYLRSSGLDNWGDMGPADISGMPRHRRTQLNQLTNWANSMYGNG
jgi:hypothetical protein